MKKILMLLSIFVVGLVAKPVVTVSIIPEKYFVEQIAGDTVDVSIMVRKGAEPATYEPKPKQMSDLAKSDIYFAIGVPFEKVWLKKFKSLYPKLNVVMTSDGIKKRKMKAHHHHHEGEAHHDEHETHHAKLDPHIWLDPQLVKIQAETIANALMKKYPKNKALYKKNLDTFLTKLDALDKEIVGLLKDKKGKKFLVFHPAWGYFADRYGLVQEAIEIEGKEPKPKALKEIINEAKEDGVGVIFVQPQFSQKSAKTIALAIKGEVLAIDPLESDWANGLKKSAKILSKSLK